jgi:hypothetical protein
MKPFLIILLLLSTIFISVSAQEKVDSIAILRSKDRILTRYEKAMEGTHHLYNGSEYFEYEPIDDEHPYFLTEEWSYSDLKYDGDWYRNVPLMLNLDKDKLIASYYHNGNLMQLVERRVDEFTLQGHRFINLKNTTDSTTLKTGYYEVLYNGNTPVFVKRSKELIEKLEGIEITRKFTESSQVFIVSNGQFIKVRNLRDVTVALRDKKKEIKDYIRSQRLFQKNRDLAIVEAVNYYDKINVK